MPGAIGEAFITVSPDLSGFDTKVLSALESSMRSLGTQAGALSSALDQVDPEGLQRLSAAGAEAVRDLEAVAQAAQDTNATIKSIGGAGPQLSFDDALRDLDRLVDSARDTDDAIDRISATIDVETGGATGDMNRLQTSAEGVENSFVGIAREARQAGSAVGTIDPDVDSTEVTRMVTALDRLVTQLGQTGTAAVQTGGKVGGLTRDLKNAAIASSGFGATLQKIGPRLKDIGFETISELGSQAVTAVGGAVKSLLTMGVTAAATAEQTRIAFAGLLGGADRGNAFFDELQQFAAATPFEFTGLAKSAQTFLALGQSTDEVITNLEAVGSAAAAAGASAESIDRVTVALAQIQGAGRLTADNLNQISDALTNVPRTAVFDVLAEKMNISSQEVQKLSENGKILSEDAIPAIIEAMRRVPGAAGALEAQAQSLNGIISTFKDNVQIELTGAFEGLGDVLKDQADNALPVVGEALQSVGTTIAEVAEDIIPLLIGGLAEFAPAVSAAVKAVGRFATEIGPGLLDLGDALTSVFESSGDLAGAFGGVVSSNLQTFASLLRTAAPLLEAFGRLLAAIPTPLLTVLVGFRQLKSAMDPIFAGASGGLFGRFSAGFQGIATQAPKAGQSINDIAANASALQTPMSTGAKVTSGFKSALGGLAGAFSGPGLAMAGVSIAVGVLAGKFQESQQRAAEFKATVEGLARTFAGVVAGTASLGDSIRESVVEQIDKLPEDIRESLGDSGITTDLLTEAIKGGGDALDVFRDKARGLGIDLKGASLKEFFSGAIGTQRGVLDVTAAADQLAAAFRLDREEAEALADQLEDFDDAVQGAAKSALNKARIDGLLTAEQERLFDTTTDYVALLGQSGSAVQEYAKETLTAARANGELSVEQAAVVDELKAADAPGTEWVTTLSEMEEENKRLAESNSALPRSFREIAESAGGAQTAVGAAISALASMPPAAGLEQFVDLAAFNPEAFKAQLGPISEALGITEEQVAAFVDKASMDLAEFRDAARANLPVIGEEMTKLADQINAVDYMKKLRDQAAAIRDFNENIRTLLSSGSAEAVQAGILALEMGPNEGAGIAQQLVNNIHGALPGEFVAQQADIKAAFSESEGLINEAGQVLVTAGSAIGPQYVGAVVSSIDTALRSGANTGLSGGEASAYQAAARPVSSRFLEGTVAAIEAEVTAAAPRIGRAAEGAISGWTQGLWTAIDDKEQDMADAGSAMFEGPYDGLLKAGDYGSPSKVMRGLGEDTVEGYVQGLAPTSALLRAGSALINTVIVGLFRAAPTLYSTARIIVATLNATLAGALRAGEPIVQARAEALMSAAASGLGNSKILGKALSAGAAVGRASSAGIASPDNIARMKVAAGQLQLGFLVALNSPVFRALVDSVGASWVTALETGIRRKAKAKSPSRLTAELGGYMTEGFVLGLSQEEAAITDAGSSMVDAAAAGMEDSLRGLGGVNLQSVVDSVDLTSIVSLTPDLTGLEDLRATVAPAVVPVSPEVAQFSAVAQSASAGSEVAQATSKLVVALRSVRVGLDKLVAALKSVEGGLAKSVTGSVDKSVTDSVETSVTGSVAVAGSEWSEERRRRRQLTGFLEEDEVPERSPTGAPLVAYKNGVGTYADGTSFSARGWHFGREWDSIEKVFRKLEEDEVPERSPTLAPLVGYKNGVGTYADGATFDARGWHYKPLSSQAARESAAAANPTPTEATTPEPAAPEATNPEAALSQALVAALKSVDAGLAKLVVALKSVEAGLAKSVTGFGREWDSIEKPLSPLGAGLAKLEVALKSTETVLVKLSSSLEAVLTSVIQDLRGPSAVAPAGGPDTVVNGGLFIEHLELNATDVRGVFRETNTELRALARGAHHRLATSDTG